MRPDSQMPFAIERLFLQYGRDGFPLIDLTQPFTFSPGVSLLVSGSGSGKTSLFRLLSGWFQEKQGGDVRAECRVNFDPYADVDFVGNHQGLLPWRSTLSNLKMRCPEAAEEELVSLCVAVGLSAKAIQAWPYELSLGMYKRVEFVAAVVSARPLIFLDELFTSLDAATRKACLDIVVGRLAASCVVVSTHSPESFPKGFERLRFNVGANERTISGIRKEPE